MIHISNLYDCQQLPHDPELQREVISYLLYCQYELQEYGEDDDDPDSQGFSFSVFQDDDDFEVLEDLGTLARRRNLKAKITFIWRGQIPLTLRGNMASAYLDRKHTSLNYRVYSQSQPPSGQPYSSSGFPSPTDSICFTIRSKSLSNNRSCTMRYFSYSLSAWVLAISAVTLPASCRILRSVAAIKRFRRDSQSCMVMGILRSAISSATSR